MPYNGVALDGFYSDIPCLHVQTVVWPTGEGQPMTIPCEKYTLRHARLSTDTVRMFLAGLYKSTNIVPARNNFRRDIWYEYASKRVSLQRKNGQYSTGCILWIFTSPDDQLGFYPGQWLVPFFCVSHFQEERRSPPRSWVELVLCKTWWSHAAR